MRKFGFLLYWWGNPHEFLENSCGKMVGKMSGKPLGFFPRGPSYKQFNFHFPLSYKKWSGYSCEKCSLISLHSSLRDFSKRNKH